MAVITLDLESEKAKQLAKELNDVLAAEMAYLKAHGAKSAEGYYHTPSGPTFIDEDD